MRLRLGSRAGQMTTQLVTLAKTIKRDVRALYLAASDRRVPWYAKAAAIVVAGYALSPIDLIPDFIPVLGYLDDVILVPLGIILVVKLIPSAVMSDLREQAAKMDMSPVNRTAALVVIAVWVVVLALAGWALWDAIA